MKPNERLAVIDLGSNSFRLVVFMAGDGWWKRTDEIYESVRIGQGLGDTGMLGDRPMERTCLIPTTLYSPRLTATR